MNADAAAINETDTSVAVRELHPMFLECVTMILDEVCVAVTSLNESLMNLICWYVL